MCESYIVPEIRSLGIDESKKSILIRLEESKAAYISDKNLRIQPLSFVDHVVDTFGAKNNVIILCRYPDQIRRKFRYNLC